MFYRYMFIMLILLFIPLSALAQKYMSGLRTGHHSFKSESVQMEGDIKDVLLQLEYPENTDPGVLNIDLNKDREPEIIIQSSQSLCGTGGCIYILIEGDTKRKIGEFFGSVLLITDKKVGGFPVIHSYSSLSANGGNYNVYVHDGTTYVQVSTIYLTGEAVDTLFEDIKTHYRLVNTDN